MNANPYFVLGLSPEASVAEIERTGKKLLGLLDIGSERAQHYECALGTFPRDATLVRESLAALRDERKRAKWSFEASLLRSDAEAPPSTAAVPLDAPVRNAFARLGLVGFEK